jgi:hypothetical protein
MRALKATIIAIGAVSSLVWIAVWTADHAGAVYEKGEALSLGLRLATTMSQWYIRLLPVLAVIVPATAAAWGWFSGRHDGPSKRAIVWPSQVGWLCVSWDPQ